MPRLEVLRPRKFNRVLSRPRSWTVSAGNVSQREPSNRLISMRHKGSVLELGLSVLYLISMLAYAIGSVLFLPEFEAIIDVGCDLFIFASVGLLVVATVDLQEARVAGGKVDEIVIQIMYIMGALSFVVGTVFYFPDIEDATGLAGATSGGCERPRGGLPLSARLQLILHPTPCTRPSACPSACPSVALLARARACVGLSVRACPPAPLRRSLLAALSLLVRSGLFTFGSVAFVLATFVNGVHASAQTNVGLPPAWTVLRTNLAMLGSCAFLVGSVLFIPELECTRPTCGRARTRCRRDAHQAPKACDASPPSATHTAVPPSVHTHFSRRPIAARRPGTLSPCTCTCPARSCSSVSACSSFSRFGAAATHPGRACGAATAQRKRWFRAAILNRAFT